MYACGTRESQPRRERGLSTQHDPIRKTCERVDQSVWRVVPSGVNKNHHDDGRDGLRQDANAANDTGSEVSSGAADEAGESTR